MGTRRGAHVVPLTAAAAHARAAGDGPSLARGFLAALPLFAAYEIGVLGGTGVRASAERVLWVPLDLAGAPAWMRSLALGVAAVLAVQHARRTPGHGPPVVRSVGVGIGAGVVLAPLLVVLLSWTRGIELVAAREPARGLAALLALVGAAPWEELLFRVGVYALLYLVAARAARFLGAPAAAGALLAELLALLGSSLAFALFHLDAVQALLGLRGEPFLVGLFAWRLLAGLVLGALVRLRGLGVVAWAHALFNLGIALGIPTGT